MTDLSNLPSDEASTLRLLASGKSAADVAELLNLEVGAVQTRALRGADKLASNQSVSLAESERARVLAVLFSESKDDPLLAASPAAQAYASVLQDKLNLGGLTMETQGTQATEVLEQPRPSATSVSADPKPAAKQQPAPDRKRGRVLLAVGAVALVGVIAAVVGTGGDGGKGTSTSTSSSNATQSATNGWTIRNRFTLKSVDGSAGKALAGVETKGEASALLIAGNGLTPGTTVGIWLTGGGSSGLIGFQNVNSKGQFSAVGPLPKNLQNADSLVVTRETVKQGQPVPKTPGTVILSSPFSLS